MAGKKQKVSKSEAAYLSHIVAADDFFELEKWQEAISAYKKALRLNPSDDISWSRMGTSYEEIGERRKAIFALKRATHLNPDDAAAWDRLGLIFNKSNQFKAAEAMYAMATNVLPNSSYLWGNYATTLYNQGKPLKAMAAYKRALRHDPKDLDARKGLAELFYEQEEYAAAFKHFEKAIPLEPKNEILWRGCFECLFRMGKYEKALLYIKEAQKLKPDNKYITRRLATALDSLGRYEEAALEWDKCYFDAHSGLDHWWGQSGSLAEAGKHDRALASELNYQSLLAKRVRKELEKEPSGRFQRVRRPTILSATIDLKLTPDGQIKICEFNDAWKSGYEGYKSLTGKDMQLDVLWGHRNRLIQELREEGLGVRDSLHARHPSDTLRHLTKSISRYSDSSVLFENCDPGFIALCENKDFLALSIPERAQEFFPVTAQFALSDKLDDAFVEQCLKDKFGPDQERLVVVKPPDGLQGKGVTVMPLSQVVNYIKAIAGPEKPDDFWESSIPTTVLVQECVRSKPVQAKDGLQYDGTMRVYFTAVFRPDDDKPEIHFHSSWWKLPPKDISAGRDDRESIVSCPPSSLTDKSNATFKAKPFAASVDSRDKYAVQKKLRECLTILLPEIVATPEDFCHLLTRMLYSRDPVKCAVATRLATSATLGDFLAIHGGRTAAYELVEKILDNEKMFPEDAASRYVSTLRRAFNPETPASGIKYAAFANTAIYVKNLIPR